MMRRRRSQKRRRRIRKRYGICAAYGDEAAPQGEEVKDKDEVVGVSDSSSPGSSTQLVLKPTLRSEKEDEE